MEEDGKDSLISVIDKIAMFAKSMHMEIKLRYCASWYT